MTRYGSIYVVTNTATGEQYVGQTRQKAVRRWRCHVNTANSKVATKYKLAKAILECGESAFKFSEVFSAFDADALDAAEIGFIAELAPAYNITKGGAGHKGVAPSIDVCRARSERLKRQWLDPVWRAQQIEKFKKTASSPEARERGKRVAILGSSARAKKVFCVETQQLFFSVADAARVLGLSHSGVRHGIAHKIKVRRQYTLQEVAP
jgi:hypothetical protein